MKIQRLAAFKRKLAALPETTREEVRVALQKGAEEMTDFARRAVPTDEYDLQNSIGWEFGSPGTGGVSFGRTSAKKARKATVTSAAVGDAGLAVTIHAGDSSTTSITKSGQTYQNAILQEFGTRKMPANPFFFPAYRLTKKRAKSRITRATNKAAKRVAAGG